MSFPFKDINIEEYVKDYEICGEVRFNAAHLPDRMNVEVYVDVYTPLLENTYL